MHVSIPGFLISEAQAHPSRAYGRYLRFCSTNSLSKPVHANHKVITFTLKTIYQAVSGFGWRLVLILFSLWLLHVFGRGEETTQLKNQQRNSPSNSVKHEIDQKSEGKHFTGLHLRAKTMTLDIRPKNPAGTIREGGEGRRRRPLYNLLADIRSFLQQFSPGSCEVDETDMKKKKGDQK